MYRRRDKWRESYDRIGAALYRFRTPYAAQFIEKLVANSCLSNGRILDLCTGSGQFACALSDHVDQITAVDGSKDMLSLAETRENIKFVHADINDNAFLQKIAQHGFSHITVARGLHWIDDEALRHYTSRVLDSYGTFITAASGYSDKNPWIKKLHNLSRDIHDTQSEGPDWRGTKRLPDFGLPLVNTVKIYARMRAPVQAVAGAIMFRAGVPNQFKKDRQTLQDYFRDVDERSKYILQPYATDGMLDTIVVANAFIFKK